MKRSGKAICAGFTLIEIVIVLAVIFILAAILFAVIGRVREKGRQTVCLNNLKQLTLAVQQYTADHDGNYPSDWYQAQLVPYIKPTGWIECPTHEALSVAKEIPLLLSSTPFPAQHVRLGPSYIYGYWFDGVRLNDKIKERRGITFIGHSETTLDASTTWVFGDDQPNLGQGAGSGGLLAYDNCDSVGGPKTTLHSGGGNYAFLDGHAKWLTPAQINALFCPSNN